MKILYLLLAYFQITISGPGTSLSGPFTTVPDPSSLYVFSATAETDDADLVPPWGFNNGGVLNTNLSFVFAGAKSYEFHYNIAAGAPASQDKNVWVSRVVAGGYERFYFRAYIYQKTPVSGADVFITQRKYLRFSDSTSPGSIVGDWVVSLTSFTAGGSVAPPAAIPLAFSAQAEVDSSVGNLGWDAWHSIEMEIILNTPGASDGTVRIWVDGVQTFSRTNRNIRGSDASSATSFTIGAQTNRTNSEYVEDFRYIDNVVVSTGYIGP